MSLIGWFQPPVGYRADEDLDSIRNILRPLMIEMDEQQQSGDDEEQKQQDEDMAAAAPMLNLIDQFDRVSTMTIEDRGNLTPMTASSDEDGQSLQPVQEEQELEDGEIKEDADNDQVMSSRQRMRIPRRRPSEPAQSLEQNLLDREIRAKKRAYRAKMAEAFRWIFTLMFYKQVTGVPDDDMNDVLKLYLHCTNDIKIETGNGIENRNKLIVPDLIVQTDNIQKTRFLSSQFAEAVHQYYADKMRSRLGLAANSPLAPAYKVEPYRQRGQGGNSGRDRSQIIGTLYKRRNRSWIIHRRPSREEQATLTRACRTSLGNMTRSEMKEILGPIEIIAIYNNPNWLPERGSFQRQWHPAPHKIPPYPPQSHQRSPYRPQEPNGYGEYKERDDAKYPWRGEGSLYDCPNLLTSIYDKYGIYIGRESEVRLNFRGLRPVATRERGHTTGLFYILYPDD